MSETHVLNHCMDCGKPIDTDEVLCDDCERNWEALYEAEESAIKSSDKPTK